MRSSCHAYGIPGAGRSPIPGRRCSRRGRPRVCLRPLVSRCIEGPASTQRDEQPHPPLRLPRSTVAQTSATRSHAARRSFGRRGAESALASARTPIFSLVSAGALEPLPFPEPTAYCSGKFHGDRRPQRVNPAAAIVEWKARSRSYETWPCSCASSTSATGAGGSWACGPTRTVRGPRPQPSANVLPTTDPAQTVV
jgi:hypothetical protein